MEELLDLVDENNRVIGSARRSECHGDPGLMHRAVHLLVYNTRRELYLQHRSMKKTVQPGKWDTSVGGHLSSGEEFVDGLFRESREELSLTEFNPCFMYSYIMSNEYESEMIGTFICVTEQPLIPNPDEISEGRYWTEPEIEGSMGRNLFTPNFEEEYSRFQDWRRRYQHRFDILFSPDLGFCKE
jgi:isopentenyldiphosphate isomerase